METEEQINKGPEETQDEVGQLTEAEMQDLLKKDIEAYTKSLEDAKKSKERYEKQWEVDKELWDIVSKDNNARKVNPEFGYELNDRYWELKETKLNWQIEQETHMAEARIKQFDEQIKMTEEALVGSKEKYVKFGGVIDDE